MKKAFVIAVALAAGCTAERPLESTPEAQAQLAEELAGRTAGPAVSCVNLRDLRGNRTVGDSILFDGPGSLIYVNRGGGSCPDLRVGRALRTRTSSGRLCRGDIAVVFDPQSGIEYGGCGLGDFTPYRRPGQG